MNEVTIMGHLGKDVEKKTSKSGDPMAVFSIATKYGEKTDWHSVVAFGKQAEWAYNLRKGDLALVRGRINYSDYVNKDGQKVYRTDIFANSVLNLSGRKAEKETTEELPF